MRSDFLKQRQQHRSPNGLTKKKGEHPGTTHIPSQANPPSKIVPPSSSFYRALASLPTWKPEPHASAAQGCSRPGQLHYNTRLATLVYLLFLPVAPVAQRHPCNLLTRWDVSSIPANGIFSQKK